MPRQQSRNRGGMDLEQPRGVGGSLVALENHLSNLVLLLRSVVWNIPFVAEARRVLTDGAGVV